MEEEKREFRVKKHYFVTTWIGIGCYLLLVAVLLSQVILGSVLLKKGSLGGIGKLLWNAEAYTWLMFIIEALLLLYCAFEAVSGIGAMRRLKAEVLVLDAEGVHGTSIPKPSGWGRGVPFTVSYGEIVSTALLDIKLFHNSTCESVVINTPKDSFVIPGIEKAEQVRKQIEAARYRGFQP